jgi:ferredoxin
VLSCPFEVLHLSGRRSLPDPCDLCRGNPACVRACPTGALELIELNGKSLRRKRALSRKLLSMREKLNGGEALTSSGPLS